MLTLDRLKRYLDIHGEKIKAVSFDVFDTLLMRLVPSECVSKLSAENLHRLLTQNEIFLLSEKDIIKSRYNFIARVKKRTSVRNAEWMLSQWLNDLAKKNDLDQDLLIHLGSKAELDAEEMSVRISDNAREVLEFVKGQELMLIATSDMWMDQEWLKELLVRFGFTFDHVFTSGTLGCSKKNGSIFKEIEKQLGYPGEALLHVGDKFRADYLYPKIHGWKTLWFSKKHFLRRMNVPPKFRVGPLRPEPFEYILQALEMPLFHQDKDPYYRLAYNYLAPVLILFSIMQWRIFRRQGVEISYYIARDAYMMKEIYDIIDKMLPGSCQWRYIYLSRRAVALAHPDNFLQNVIPLPGKVGRKTIGDWLGNFPLNDDLRHSILSEAGLKENDNFNNGAKSLLRSACKSHLKEIEKIQDALRTDIRDYLLQQSGKARIERIGIVDSGWACTTQDSIRAAFENSTILSGVYLGVSYQGNKPSTKNNKYGLLRDDFRKPMHQNPIESTAGVVRVWDTLLREPEKTVSSIKRLADGKVIPVFSSTAAIGELERRAFNSILEGVRKGTTDRLKGIALIAKMNESFADNDYEMTATSFAERMTTCPDHDTASAVINLGFDEGTVGGKSGSLGWKGMKEGVSWYPGILAKMKMGWMSHVLKVIAKAVLKKRNSHTCPAKPH